MAPLVWLVTGSTSGIGAALANEIVARGDKVIASGRQVERKLSHLKSDSFALLELDTATGLPEVEIKIKEAWGIFGHIDVLVNNAGIASVKSAEEAE
jgi:NADP-dependent 3-hydroxy acid dehydrogenase YdfG